MALTVTVSPEVGNSPPRVRITVTNTVATNDLVTVMRRHPDGSDHRVITERAARLSAGSWVGFDYFMPYGRSIRYSASTEAVSSGLSAPTFVPSKRAWLIPPGDPGEAYRPSWIASIGDDSFEDRAGVFSIVGASAPVSVDDDAPAAITSSVTIGVKRAELATAQSFIRAGRSLLLNLPVGKDFDQRWIRPQRPTISNPAAQDHPSGQSGYPHRLLTIPYTLIQQPDIDLAPLWSLDDLEAYSVANGITLATMSATWPTLAKLSTDTRS